MYSLPVNARTWPSATTCRSRSIALAQSSSSKSPGSAPTTFSMKVIVSRISVSSVIRPLRSARVISSSKLPTSPVTSAL